MSILDLIVELRSKGGSLEVNDGKLIAKNISSSMLEKLKENKAEVIAFLSSSTSCSTCEHITRKKSCGEPVLAGLSTHFSIVWHPIHGRGCPAWTPKDVVVTGTHVRHGTTSAVFRSQDAANEYARLIGGEMDAGEAFHLACAAED